VARALVQPDVHERFVQLGLEATAPHTPEEFLAFMRKDAAKYATIIKTSGAKGE
jgi:tripartite-type tricarboxylate transporter receptor subunit TctC